MVFVVKRYAIYPRKQPVSNLLYPVGGSGINQQCSKTDTDKLDLAKLGFNKAIPKTEGKTSQL
jgi:hypothetical protein